MSYIGNTALQQSFVPAVQYFSGDGATTAFTLSRPVASVAQIVVFIENVPQNPTSAFTVLNNTITFTSAPPTGTNNIWVEYVSINTSAVSPSDGTVTTNALATSAVTTAKIADANVTQAKLETLVVPVGVGQTWTYLTASRALNTSYTNTTGRPIFVMAEVYCAYNVTCDIYINGTRYGGQASAGGASYWQGFMGFVVPAGSTYQLANGSSLIYWAELR